MLSAPPPPRQKGPHPAAPKDAHPGDHSEDDELFRAMLDEILEIGMQITRLAGEEAAALGSDKASIVFDRVTRAIRRTMLLSKKLTETRREPARNAPAANTRNRNEARAQVGAQIRAQMKQAAHSGPPDPSDSAAEPNDDTAPDRLDSIGTGTIPEIIASLCKDLASAAATLGKPTQRALLLATTSTTPTPGHPVTPTKNPLPTAAEGSVRLPNPQPNPARYRGSG